MDNRDDAQKGIFQLTMEIKCQSKETFQLFYILDSKNENYADDRREVIQVNPNSELQTIKLSLEQGIKPKKLRIDLGEKRNQSTIVINKIEIRFNEDEIIITPDLFNKLLSPNIYVTRNKNEFKRSIVKDRYDPFLESTALLDKMMYLKFR